ncbi:MAG: CPBP family intramembrane glutamic endopeptidase, partial [Terracidiphilus sp.]
MSSPETGGGRIRAYLQFIAAVCYFFLARSLARHGALGLASRAWAPLVEQAMLVFLLLLGYAAMGSYMDRQSRPASAQGLPRRTCWLGEVGLGLSVGWTIAVICVLPLVVAGGIAIVLVLQPSAWEWLLADAAFFALWALAEEIAFRGYGFQRFVHAVGPLGAALGYAAFYAILQALLPGASRASVAVSIAFSLVLSMAYLRTRALWMSWGINFGWKASQALVFGLAVSGLSSHSPVVQGDPMGPFWLTGGGFGLDGTWFPFFVFLAALPVVYRLTRELDFVHNAPVIIPGGIPVDLDAAARAQHEAAMGAAEPAAPGLVQILPATSPAPMPTQESTANE